MILIVSAAIMRTQWLLSSRDMLSALLLNTKLTGNGMHVKPRSVAA
jgi:hypothetical protein